MTDKLGRRALLGLRRPASPPSPNEPPPRVALPTPAAAPPVFSLEAFYASRTAGADADVALPAFVISAPTCDAEGHPIATAVRGTPELANRVPAPWERATTKPLPSGLVPRVRTTTCLAFRSTCTVCSERCPEEGAIRTSAGRPMVMAERCTGCGACVAACPAPISGFEIVPRSEGGA